MTTTNNILHTYNECDEANVERMMGKAICAYANMREVQGNRYELDDIHGKAQVELHIESLRSEYEATVRCIDMFVRESIPQICKAVMNRSAEELGVC